MVDNTAAIARLANRVILVAKQESDNSEDTAFIQRVNQATDILQNSVAPMVQDAKLVAININDNNAVLIGEKVIVHFYLMLDKFVRLSYFNQM